MIVPNLTYYSPFPSSFTVYCASDENYFNLYGKYLINSVIENTDYNIYIHLYNPSHETIDWCNDKNVSYSIEQFDTTLLDNAFNRWVVEQNDITSIKRKADMIKDNSEHQKLSQELLRTYYACTRFIRLAEILSNPTPILMLDVDSLVRKPILLPSTLSDICVFEKKKKRGITYTQHLASTIYYTGTRTSYDLIKDHSQLIVEHYNLEEIYWFLDQDTLDKAIVHYSKTPLDLSFVDFNFSKDSSIWCAKGQRKHLDDYKLEMLRYQ